MSPEQASAEEVDHRADVFALGVVLWEALTGRRLFRRETELATMRAIVDDPITAPVGDACRSPPELDAIVMRALRKRKDARFATAHEMAVALETFAFSQPGFSPMQIAGYTKSLFATEYLQWRKTATAALDLEVEKPPPGSRMRGPQRGAADRRPDDGVAPGGFVGGRPQRAAQRGRAEPQQRQPGQAAQPRSRGPVAPVAEVRRKRPRPARGVVAARDRTWLYAVVGALLAAIGGGAWMLTRQQEIPALGSQSVAPRRPSPRPPSIDADRRRRRLRHGRDGGRGDAPSPAAAAPAPSHTDRRSRARSRRRARPGARSRARQSQARLAHTVTRAPAASRQRRPRRRRRKRPRRRLAKPTPSPTETPRFAKVEARRQSC